MRVLQLGAMLVSLFAAAPQRRAEYTCPGHLHFLATFEDDNRRAAIQDWSGHTYQLRRTAELGGRKYENEAGNVIFVVHDSRTASLTLIDVHHRRSKIPVEIDRK